MKIDHPIIEPLMLSIDMEHYLNVIKEITVTESFLSSNEQIRGCQEESFDECTTRKYKKTIMNKCNCLPFQIRLNEEVKVAFQSLQKQTSFISYPCV